MLPPDSAACVAGEVTPVASEAPSESSEAGGEPSGAALPDSSAGASSELGGSSRLLPSPSGSFRPLLWAGGREKGKGKVKTGSERGGCLFLIWFSGFQRATPMLKAVSGTACSFDSCCGWLSPVADFIPSSLQRAQNRSPKEPVAPEDAHSHQGCVSPYQTARSSKVLPTTPDAADTHNWEQPLLSLSPSQHTRPGHA